MWTFALSLAAAAAPGTVEGRIDVRGPVWVWLRPHGDVPELPVASGTMRQVGQQFLPQGEPRQVSSFPPVLVVARGAVVEFPNDGPDQHEVYWVTPVNDKIDLYPARTTEVRTFEVPGVYPIGCGIHESMSATILVVENDWFAKGDARGQFSIPNVAPGTYTVVAWSPYGQATLSKEIVVESGATVRFGGGIE